jgi:non-heme chloroperoxidase
MSSADSVSVMLKPSVSSALPWRGTRSFETADGARLAYHIVGPSPPSVVLVHGWMASGKVWDRLLDALDANGAPGVLLVDLRGAGSSSRGSDRYSLDRLVEDLRAVVDHAQLSRFHLVGHSMGGQLAQLLAAHIPTRLRSLALLNPVPVAGLPLPPEVATGFRSAGGRAEALGGILDAACRQLPRQGRDELLEAALAIAPEVIAEGFDAWTMGSDDELATVPAVPSMVLATDDPFLPAPLLARAVVARLPGARLEHLPGPGHYPQVERPEPTAQHLQALWRLA